MNHDPISMNHNILSVRPLYDGASDIQLIKPTGTATSGFLFVHFAAIHIFGNAGKLSFFLEF